MSYTQFGYSPFPPTTQLMVGTSVNTSVVSSSPCCGDNSRGSGGASAENQAAVLPATYEPRLLSTYPRLAPSGLYPGATPYGDPQPYSNFPGVDSSAFYPSLSSPYGMKDASDPWRSITTSASYYYDPSLAAYGYGGLDFNGARRKNVTRDSTSTLKAWLNEHRKNPYPTKGEKIMLAIITKMTLTQVSTWFANARRRLKKENKMTWEPRNKMDADDMKDFDDDDDDMNKNDRNGSREESESGGSRKASDSVSNRGCAVPHHPPGITELRPRCDSEDSEDGGRPLTSGDESVDGAGQYRQEDPFLHRNGYHILRHHPGSVPSNMPLRPTDGMNPDAPSILQPTDFTPGDSSSSSVNGPDMRTLMQSPETTADNKNSSSPTRNSSSTHEDIGDPMIGVSKPKIWSLADTATSKTPPTAGANASENGVPDMIGQCGWFSVNPYQVNGSSTFGGYHHHHHHAPAFVPPSGNSSTVFASGTSSSTSMAHGFSPVPPQTDTPPQTPPNMKVTSTLPLGACSYIGQSAAQLYAGQASPATLATAVQAAKSCGSYLLTHRSGSSRTQMNETIPEDFSQSGQYSNRSAPIQ